MNTMNEEKKILKQFGKDNSFSVPEGYFDTLTSRIMSNIPAEETKVVSINQPHHLGWLKWAGLAAACMVGAVVGINMPGNTESTSGQAYSNQAYTGQSQTTYSDNSYNSDYQEEMLDYAMVDYNDVYNYLSGDEY